MMYDRYNVELSSDYLNNTCTMGNRFGMFPTVEMVEEYNTINFRPSIIPTKETSQLRALFAEVIPSTDNNLFVLNRFKKLVGYRNILFPLSKRYPTLLEMSNELYNITTVHDIANYGKFARMLQIVTEQNNIPISFNKVEQWESEKTITPNETITTEGEINNTSNMSDTTETDSTGTDTITGTDTNRKTGTDTTQSGTTKTVNETVSNTVAPFDSDDFNNESKVTTANSTTDSTATSTTYNTSDALTKNTTNTKVDNISTERTATNTGNTEKTETKTRTGENTEAENGHRYINTGLSMAELIERENVLLPVFDMYLLSIAREITLSSVEEIY